MRISAIIPTLNEEETIGRTLDVMLALEPGVEVIVVDGGSSDRTAELVKARGVLLLETARGRGVQLHAGACAASGDVFWFVHADTLPEPDVPRRMLEALRCQRVSAGNCTLIFDGSSAGARWLTWLYPHLRKLGLCYGDSGLFVRRSAYRQVGGFRPLPLFEDLDLVRRLRRLRGWRHLSCGLITSSRRFEGRCFAVVFAHWTALQTLYWLGVPPGALAKAYPLARSADRRPQPVSKQ